MEYISYIIIGDKMVCQKCGYWYCGKCYNTNTEKDALDEACALFIPFNRNMYIAIKNGNTAFIQNIKKQEIKI